MTAQSPHVLSSARSHAWFLWLDRTPRPGWQNMGTAVLATAAVVTGSFLSDVLHALLDPRVRTE